MVLDVTFCNAPKVLRLFSDSSKSSIAVLVGSITMTEIMGVGEGCNCPPQVDKTQKLSLKSEILKVGSKLQ